MWIVGILLVLVVVAFLFGELKVAAKNADIRRLRAEMEWEKKRARDLEWNVGCFEGAYNRQNEHLVALEAEIRSLKRNDAASAGARSSLFNAPDPTKRLILPTRAATPGIAKPSTDLANLPSRSAFTGLSASGTKLPPSSPVFPSTLLQAHQESTAVSRPSLFGPMLPQTTSQSNAASGPSLFGTNLPQSNAPSQLSVFLREYAPRPDFGLFGDRLNLDARPIDPLPSFAPHHQAQGGAQTSGLFGNNPFDPSSTGFATGFNIASGEPPTTALNRVLSEGRSISNHPPLPSLPSSLLSLEQLEEIQAAKHKEDQNNAQ